MCYGKIVMKTKFELFGCIAEIKRINVWVLLKKKIEQQQ